MQLVSRKEAIEKGLTHYFTGKPCPHGHVAQRFVSSYGCEVCAKNYYNERRKEKPELYKGYNKKHYDANREKCIAASMAWSKNNPEKKRESRRRHYHSDVEASRKKDAERYAANPERKIKAARDWRLNNLERSREYFRKYRKERLATDPDFKMRMVSSLMVRRVLNATDTPKKNNTESLLGYSGAELRAHLELNMASGMNWENYGKVWHIDHVVPVMEMIRLGIKDVKRINALSNLMPEFAEVNQSNGDRFSLSAPHVK